MYIQRLILSNYKNISEADITFDTNINCFVGNNGAGKTNILSAIHYLALCKDYFNLSDSLNVRQGENFFIIDGYFNRKGTFDRVYCAFDVNKKKIVSLNGKEYERFSDHIGYLPLVMITPTDTMIIYQGSEERRRLLNFMISQYNRTYLNTLIKYNKILENRNKLLKQIKELKRYDTLSLEVYDHQLAKLGSEIYSARKLFIEDYLATFSRFHQILSPDNEEVGIVYESRLHDDDIFQALQVSHSSDIIAGFTTVGIHKDDLEFTINRNPLKKFGSQGQQKTFIIAMKLAYYEYTYHKTGIKPLLLLDDIFDKLDIQRVEKIVSLVAADNFGQIFITDANKIRVENILEKIGSSYRIFSVNLGKIESLHEKTKNNFSGFSN